MFSAEWSKAPAYKPQHISSLRFEPHSDRRSCEKNCRLAFRIYMIFSGHPCFSTSLKLIIWILILEFCQGIKRPLVCYWVHGTMTKGNTNWPVKGETMTHVNINAVYICIESSRHNPCTNGQLSVTSTVYV